MKIPYLPTIRPGELFNSVFIRMLWHQMDDICLHHYFRHRHTPSLPVHYGLNFSLSFGDEAVPSSWGIDPISVIRSCCTLPFASPYLVPEVRQRQLEWVSGKISSRRAPIVFAGQFFGSYELSCARTVWQWIWGSGVSPTYIAAIIYLASTFALTTCGRWCPLGVARRRLST